MHRKDKDAGWNYKQCASLQINLGHNARRSLRLVVIINPSTSYNKENIMALYERYVSVSFAGADLHGQVLSGEFVDCDFSAANLCDAQLSGEFVNCTFDDANISGADCSAAAEAFVDTPES
jgi:uncharacterized protein YjbI with pentapeptide repeats